MLRAPRLRRTGRQQQQQQHQTGSCLQVAEAIGIKDVVMRAKDLRAVCLVLAIADDVVRVVVDGNVDGVDGRCGFVDERRMVEGAGAEYL